MSLNLTVWFFGFISGFLLLVTGNTLNFWLTKEGCDIQLVGLFSLVSIPYAFNFLWAPIFDSVKLKFIPINANHRIKWLIVLHLLGATGLASICLFDPIKSPFFIAIFAVFIAFVNSSQDLILNALRSEITPPKLQAESSGVYVFGYRCGMVLSGPVAIFVSGYTSWQNIYFMFAFIYFCFPVILYISHNNQIDTVNTSESLSSKTKPSFKSLLAEIGKPKTVFLILLFLALYRIADNFISVMINPFLLHHGFSESQIAIAGKLCGVLGAGFGGLLAGRIMSRNPITLCLFWFAVIHASAHSCYIVIAYVGANSLALFIATLLESITGGMTMAAYIGLITKLCRGKYRATQYALFTAMMGVSRTILPSFAGYIVETTGWTIFFVFAILMVIPSILILKLIEPKLLQRIND